MGKQNFSEVQRMRHFSEDGISRRVPKENTPTVLCRSSASRMLILAFVIGSLWAGFYWALT